VGLTLVVRVRALRLRKLSSVEEAA
jgi:hypothetical protein